MPNLPIKEWIMVDK